MAAEERLRSRICPRLIEHGVFLWSNVDAMGMVGLPDTSFVHLGVAGFIEWKSDENGPSKKQRQFLANMAKAGGLALIVKHKPDGAKPWCATYQIILPDGSLSFKRYPIISDYYWLNELCLALKVGHLQ